MEILAGGYFLVGLFLVLLAGLWIILPFALFGMKGLLRQLIDEQRRTNALLERMQDTAGGTAPVQQSPPATNTPVRLDSARIHARAALIVVAIIAVLAIVIFAAKHYGTTTI